MRNQIESVAKAVVTCTACCLFWQPSALAGSVSAGQEVFRKASCEGCHPDGSNALNPGRPIKGAKFQKRYKDDAVLEQVIRQGFPSAGMPAFPTHVINDKEMKALIAYIRSLTPKSQ